MQKLIDYLSVPGKELSDGLSAQMIETELKERHQQNNKVLPSATKPSTHAKVKLELLDPKPFSGSCRDFWDWIDTVHDAFGRASLSEALTDKDFHLKDPELSTAGFFHLSTACKQGTQAHLPDKVKLANGRRTVAYDLYEALMQVFNTPTARTHFLTYAVECLTSI